MAAAADKDCGSKQTPHQTQGYEMPTTNRSRVNRGSLLLAVSTLLVLTCDAASAASFDCKKASTAAERTICGNANLSQLDARTAGIYFTILGSEVPASTLGQVKYSQRQFIDTRNACGANVDCLVDAYTSQMMFLKNVKSEIGAR
jgi:uncharacterized protein